MSDEYYKDKLSDEAYRVCRLAATERPFTGKYNEHWLDGIYICTCCDQPLFDSKSKFDSGCGWPSFYQSISEQVSYLPDTSHNMTRVEIQCAACQSHLGHVFDDGPKPTGKRYCVNSVSLQFVSRD